LAHARQTTPTCVGRGHTTTSPIREQDWQTIGHHDGANHPGLVGQTSVACGTGWGLCPQSQDLGAVYLFQEHGGLCAPLAQEFGQSMPVLRHRRGVVAHVVAQIETVVRQTRAAPASQSEKGMHAFGYLFGEQGLDRIGHQLRIWHGLEHKPGTWGHFR
jgi:hypothetical protein